jgi:hypothetical protein
VILPLGDGVITPFAPDRLAQTRLWLPEVVGVPLRAGRAGFA